MKFGTQLVFASIFSLGLAGNSLAQDSGGADHLAAQPSPISDVDAFHLQAETYAQAYGVSVEEAARRLKLMFETSDDILAAEMAVGDDLAGSYFDNGPNFAFVIRTTKSTAPGARELSAPARSGLGGNAAEQSGSRDKVVAALAAAQSAPVRYVTASSKTEKSARGMLRGQRNAIERIVGSPVVGIGYNEETGAYRVWSPGIEEIGQKQRALEAILRGPVELESTPVADRLTHTRGGAGLYSSSADTTANCTTGFVAYEGSDRTKLGVLTAGHCANSMQYKAPDGSNYPISVPSLSRERWNADMDLQWMTASHVAVGQFYADNSTAVRNVTGYRSVANTTQANDYLFRKGSFICHYGKRTGQSCGEVIDTDSAPNYSCNGQTCNDVFVEVRNKVVSGETQLACWDGDSGGPWFAYGVAFGIQSGCRMTSPAPGDTIAAFYTPIEKSSAINVTIFIP